jgi:hypothetical protein
VSEIFNRAVREHIDAEIQTGDFPDMTNKIFINYLHNVFDSGHDVIRVRTEKSDEPALRSSDQNPRVSAIGGALENR